MIGALTHCALQAMHTILCLAGSALRLEERGAAFSFGALRAAYSMGGDGESDVRLDVQNLAAFVRDPAACVTCFLLPISLHAHVEMEVSKILMLKLVC